MKEQSVGYSGQKAEYAQNYDAVCKDSFTLFKNKTRAFLGVPSDARITEMPATEKREVQVQPR
jgi:hypothetical protein